MEILIEEDEIKEILISVIAISLALSIVFAGGLGGISGIFRHPAEFLLMVAISAITIGSGFVLHEMGHKMVAIYYGAYSKFKMWTQGLILMLIVSLFGMLFAAPGAVYIYAQRISKRENGIISLAGPIVNIALVMFFFSLAIANPIRIYISFLADFDFGEIVKNGLINVWMFGAFINIILGLFNMLPAFPLDGSKVIKWSKLTWAITIVGMFAMGYALNLIGAGYILFWCFILFTMLAFSRLFFG
ncbi:MAG: site-2 protease family protein [Candidatus Bilamarchaeaceae archaeon]